MHDRLKEVGKRLWRLAIPLGGAVASIKFPEIIATARANWTLIFREQPPTWLTEGVLSPWVQPVLGVFVGGALVWALWPIVETAVDWATTRLKDRRMSVLTIAIGTILALVGLSLAWRGVSDVRKSTPPLSEGPVAAPAVAESKSDGTAPPSHRVDLAAPGAAPIVGARVADAIGKVARPVPTQEEFEVLKEAAPAKLAPPTPGLYSMVDVTYCRSQPRPFEDFTAADIKAQVARLAALVKAAEAERNAAMRAARPAPAEANDAEALARYERVGVETHEKIIRAHLGSMRNLRCEMLARTGTDRLDAISVGGSGVIHNGIITHPKAMSDVADYLIVLAKGL